MFNSSLTLTHYLEQTIFCPGDHVRGFLKLDVTKEVEVTAIRLLITGEEKVRVRDGDHTYRTSATFYSQKVTLFGHSASSGARGRVYLSPGSYTYDFDVVLPVNIPPSATFGKSSDSGGTIIYTLTGTADIPWWVDSTTSTTIEVLSQVTPAQFSQALSEALPLGRFSPGVYHCGCHTRYEGSENCFWCLKSNSDVSVTVDVYPNILLVGPDPVSVRVALPPHALDPVIPLPPDPNTIAIRLEIENRTGQPIHKVEVMIVQKMRWKAEWTTHTGAEAVELGRAVFDAQPGSAFGAIRPGSASTLEATVSIIAPSLPSVKTLFTESTTMLVVRFPELTIPDVRLDNSIAIANCLSTVDAAPRAPAHFSEKVEQSEIVV